MKKWLIMLTSLAALALLAAPFTLAAGHGDPKAGKTKVKVKFHCQAKVVSLDAATGELVVTVKSGSKAMKTCRGRQITLRIDPEARLVDATVDPSAPLTLDQLVRDARVRLGGAIDRSKPDALVFTAIRIILQRLPATPASPSPPTS